MEVTVRIPEGDKCYEDIPRYLCPFFTQESFDGAADGRCGYLNKRWHLAGMVARCDDYRKHPRCPMYTQFSDYIKKGEAQNE